MMVSCLFHFRNMLKGQFLLSWHPGKKLKESVSETPQPLEGNTETVSFKLLAQSLLTLSAIVLTQIKFFYYSMVAPYICRG